MGNLTPELEAARKKIIKVAQASGLDFFETIFEMITYDQINQFASYGGFPVRYPHWRVLHSATPCLAAVPTTGS